MSRPPITFRLTEPEWQLIENELLEGESVNQCCARLLRERLGIKPKDGLSLSENTLDEYIESKIQSHVNALKFYLDSVWQEKIESEVKLQIEMLDSKPRGRGRPPKPKTTSNEV